MGEAVGRLLLLIAVACRLISAFPTKDNLELLHPFLYNCSCIGYLKQQGGM